MPARTAFFLKELYNLCSVGWILLFVSALPSAVGSRSRSRKMTMDKAGNRKR